MRTDDGRAEGAASRSGGARAAADRADALLHPQRLAIVRLLSTAPATPGELAAALPDIAPATLYRHLATMQDADLIEVVAERRVRGAVERRYAVRSALLSAEDLATATGDDHVRYFATFLAGLLGEFGRYLGGGDVDLERDGIGYREHVLHLSDAELRELLGELRASIARRAAHRPAPGRAARLLATVSMPTTRPAPAAGDAEGAAP